MTQKRTLWLAITSDDASGELDASVHLIKEDAESAIVNELHELYGHIFNDDPPPDEYDTAHIAAWIADNDVSFNWAVRPKEILL